MPCVYILRCADGSLYIGHADDMTARLERHNAGRASSYTAQRRPVVTAHVEVLSTRTAALARERQLKRWTRRKKEALIAGRISLLKAL